jgi:hypothetical protein
VAPAIAFRPPISGAAGERAVRTLRAFASLPEAVTGRVNPAAVVGSSGGSSLNGTGDRRHLSTGSAQYVKGLARALSGHTIHTAQEKGWDTLSNGALLTAAEEAGFELLLTTDRRIRHQQNLQVRRIALVVLTGSTRWSRVYQHADRIATAVASATPGSYSEAEIPFEPKLGRA